MSERSTQAELAERISARLVGAGHRPVHQSTISSWVNGRCSPTGPRMVAVQQALGIHVNDWLEPPRTGARVARGDERSARRRKNRRGGL